MASSKCAFVTGGSRGIGSGIVMGFADRGYDVAFTYFSKPDEAEKVAEYVRSKGQRCFYYQADLRDAEKPTEVVAQAAKDLGGLDALVCNAGNTYHNLLTYTDAAYIDEVYSLDFRAYVLCAAEAARIMQKNETAGSIIFISSTRSIRAYATDAMYGAMKAALNRAAESFALELSQYGIRVNVVAPGGTAVRGDWDTSVAFARKVPLGRLGSPVDIANAVCFLSSDEAAYITGVTLKVDGGLILPGMPEDSREENGWRPDMEATARWIRAYREGGKAGVEKLKEEMKAKKAAEEEKK